MDKLLYVLPVLACPVGMGLMMWFMAKGMNRNKPDLSGSEPDPAPASVEVLREEHRRLGEQIEQLEPKPQPSPSGQVQP